MLFSGVIKKFCIHAVYAVIEKCSDDQDPVKCLHEMDKVFFRKDKSYRDSEWFNNISCLRTKRLWSACLQQGCLNSSIYWEIHQKLYFFPNFFPNSIPNSPCYLNKHPCHHVAAVTGSWLPPLKTDCTVHSAVQWVIGKIFGNFFSFQATEMVFISKWGRIQPETQICLQEYSSCLRTACAPCATLNHSGVHCTAQGI